MYCRPFVVDATDAQHQRIFSNQPENQAFQWQQRTFSLKWMPVTA